MNRLLTNNIVTNNLQHQSAGRRYEKIKFKKYEQKSPCI